MNSSVKSAKKALKVNPYTTVRDPQTGVWLVCMPASEVTSDTREVKAARCCVIEPKTQVCQISTESSL